MCVVFVSLVLFFDARREMTLELPQHMPQQEADDTLCTLIFICVSEEEKENAELRRLFELTKDHRSDTLAKKSAEEEIHKIRFSCSSYKRISVHGFWRLPWPGQMRTEGPWLTQFVY